MKSDHTQKDSIQKHETTNRSDLFPLTENTRVDSPERSHHVLERTKQECQSAAKLSDTEWLESRHERRHWNFRVLIRSLIWIMTLLHLCLATRNPADSTHNIIYP